MKSYKIEGTLKKLTADGTPIEDFEELPLSGGYALFLRLTKNLIIRTGKHGRLPLSKGRYVYIGRASRALPARLKRHCRRRKKVQWHIDHLTRRSSVRVEEILIYPHQPERECEIVRSFLKLPDTTVPAEGFGAGDCKEGCPAHLLGLSEPAVSESE